MILVTGAAGFIGFHVVQRLINDGHSVHGLDNVNDYYDPMLKEARLRLLIAHPKFTFHRADIADQASVEEIFAIHRPESVVHLAAQAGVRHSINNPRAYIDSNISGFLNILEGCRHGAVRHLVYASSSSVYGLNSLMPLSVDQNVDHPVSLYGATKKANELMAHSYSHLYDLSTTGLRFFTVYGPWGRPDMAYFSFTKAILEGKPIDVYNDGRMTRDFTYIDDVVEGIARILPLAARSDSQWKAASPSSGSSSAPYRLYNVGNHSAVELLRFIDIVESCLKKKAIKRYLPAQPGDVLATSADVNDLNALISFAPNTSIEIGVSRFVDWYKEYYAKGMA
jgi:UDP-glucuronate 4-epimerase